MTVHIQLPDGSAYPHPGLTNLLDVQVDTTTDTVVVRAQVPNPEGIFISGGVVGVTVERGAPRSLLMVPQSAVLLDQAGKLCPGGRRGEEGRAATRNDRRRARYPNGSVVRVKDVARVEMGAKSQDISTSTRPSSG